MIYIKYGLLADISPKKKSIYWVLVPGVNPNQNPKPKSIQNLILYILVKKSTNLKIFDTQKCLGLKISDFFQKFSYISLTFIRP
jgi:hypothetical protein